MQKTKLLSSCTSSSSCPEPLSSQKRSNLQRSCKCEPNKLLRTPNVHGLPASSSGISRASPFPHSWQQERPYSKHLRSFKTRKWILLKQLHTKRETPVSSMRGEDYHRSPMLSRSVKPPLLAALGKESDEGLFVDHLLRC